MSINGMPMNKIMALPLVKPANIEQASITKKYFTLISAKKRQVQYKATVANMMTNESFVICALMPINFGFSAIRAKEISFILLLKGLSFKNK